MSESGAAGATYKNNGGKESARKKGCPYSRERRAQSFPGESVIQFNGRVCFVRTRAAGQLLLCASAVCGVRFQLSVSRRY